MKDNHRQPENSDSQADTRRAIYSLIAVFVGVVLLVLLGVLGTYLFADVDSEVLDLVVQILGGLLILAGIVRLLVARGRREPMFSGVFAIGTGLLTLLSALLNR